MFMYALYQINKLLTLTLSREQKQKEFMQHIMQIRYNVIVSLGVMLCNAGYVMC